MDNTDVLKTQKKQYQRIHLAPRNNIKKKYYFLKIATQLAITYWLIDSSINYFWHDELEGFEFEIIASDSNTLLMKCFIFLLFLVVGLIADSMLRQSIENDIANIKSKSIAKAKKQWELTIDSLPQLVITIDHNARINRVNKTIEKWGMGKVNKVDGLYVCDFLKCFNKDFSDDDWTSDWPNIWQHVKDNYVLEREIEKKHIGRTYHYTIRRISDNDYDTENDSCYAVLVIDEITNRWNIENSLKKHTERLEKMVEERTLELKSSNTQLEHELQLQDIAKKELRKSQQCRLDLLRDLFNTQEKERKRIACELHDSIGQSLGATKFKVEELLMNKNDFTNEIESEQLHDLVETIKNAIQEVRNIAMDLRPAMLDDLGILPTLKWFCREFNHTYSKIEVHEFLNVDESEIPEERKVVIFRIAQESMNNIVKHANATNILLKLSNSASDLILSITDNGCGFDMNSLNNKNIDEINKDDTPPKCSFGLSSMRERAESTSGIFSIETTPDVGTRVNVIWKK